MGWEKTCDYIEHKDLIQALRMVRRKGREGFPEGIKKRDTIGNKIQKYREQNVKWIIWVVYELDRNQIPFYFRAVFKLNFTFCSCLLSSPALLCICQKQLSSPFYRWANWCSIWKHEVPAKEDLPISMRAGFWSLSSDFHRKAWSPRHQKSEPGLQEQWIQGAKPRGKKPESGVAVVHSQPWGDKPKANDSKGNKENKSNVSE